MKIKEKKVKIVATVGPATESYAMLKKLVLAGVDVFRLNLAHQNAAETIRHIKNIRRLEKEVGKPLAIMGDLAGPKIRIGEVKGLVNLTEGDEIKIINRSVVGDGTILSLNFPTILKNLKPGANVYLGDGLIKLRVIKKIPDGVLTRVDVSGVLRSKMGFAAEGLKLGFKLSRKDISDLKVLIDNGANAVAVSFIQKAADIVKVKNLMKGKRQLMVIAKIETADGVKNAESIIEVADGLMIARGDLGLSMPLPELPHIQKQLIRLGLRKAKPIITATQMLESMMKSYMPTRAEVTDVANAILDGTDAVMLSGETAMGNFPIQAVSIMEEIIETTAKRIREKHFRDEEMVPDAVSASVVEIAQQLGAKLIIVFTQTGSTARLISRHRPNHPIVALTPDYDTLHKLNFTWGASPQQTKVVKSLDDMISIAAKVALVNKVLPLKKGDKYVISAGVPFGRSGTTNLVLVQEVG